jgi:metal-sulfur cluster biosynthetic enzyme
MNETTTRPTPETVRTCLESVIDPEMGMNVIDLGTVYEVRVEGGRIEVDLTLTNPDSPRAGTIAGEVEQAVRTTFDEIADVEVGLVFDPPWSFDRLTEKGKALLGR